MHAGVALVESAAGGLGVVSSWHPAIVATLAIVALLYAKGVRVLWSQGQCRAVRPWQVVCFAAGWLVLAIALLSPLHEASEQLFYVHMIQHELLMVVAAPLLVLGHPAVVSLWAFPRGARQAIASVLRSRGWRSVWRPLSRPLDVWLLHAVAIWSWHVPVLFEAALRSDAVHAMQHVSFLGSALLFWWAVIHPRQRAALGLSVVYLFTTAIHTAVLGALMAFSRVPWYPDYAVGEAVRRVAPLADQQLAGLVMWIPASVAYLVAALVILRRWLRDSEWSVAREERVAAAL